MLTTGDLIVQETQLHFPTVISVPRRHHRAARRSAKHFEDDLRRASGGTVGDVMTHDP